ncbi:ImcF-related family protein [Pseudomonas sp. Q1-7]|uniref:ImcF-related family protein n=1 Tax=Pseudomonas sp. Q1-7 TaxID=3020843 RepID=UPI002300EFA9|nr:ImcF-related family protein [Pseudomonas sp. Q1-7]
MRTVTIWGLIGLVAVVGGGICLLLWWWPDLWGVSPGSDRQEIALWLASGLSLSLVALLVAYWQMGRKIGQSGYREQLGDDRPAKPALASDGTSNQTVAAELRQHLRDTYGLFWRRQVRLLLVLGEPDEIKAIAPALAERQWLEGEGAVLLWGGSVQERSHEALLEQWRQLCPRRPLDGIVWALNAQQGADPEHLGHGVRWLQQLTRTLRWQAPVHLWEVRGSAWAQAARPVAAVGCRLAPRAGVAQLHDSLAGLVRPLRAAGLEQMRGDNRHDFLLRLARDLQAEGLARWTQALAPLLSARDLALRGLWFSLPLPAPSGRGDTHAWRADPAWRGVLDAALGGRPRGWTPARASTALLLALMALWGLGLLLSFANNRAQIAELQAALATLDQPREGDAQWRALHELARELDRLDYRAARGVPWYQRFGLSQNDRLLEALWPRFVGAGQRLLRDPAAARLEAELAALIRLPPGSPERAARAGAGYDQLKAYLMLARPEKTDAAFLARALGAAEPAGVSAGVWQGFAPDLWRFYAEHLAAHPEWRIQADPVLVAQARRLLLGQLGQRNGESALYRRVLDAAANQYPPVGLRQLVGDTDAEALFSSAAEVPGVFTRQAWDGQVRQAIDAIAAARREDIDWVLSDDPAQVDAELSPEVLRERLTARYFQDYARAWLDLLNSLRWRPAASLADAIDQLTLMTDVRQSPLLALLNSLAYQGRAGTRGQALGEALMQSAQQLIGTDKSPVIEPQAPIPAGPLADSFGPLLALLGQGADASGNDGRLSLQAFLTRVTRVRLKLQQVSNAADPQAMTQALAQTVFQGKSVDLSDTRAYGSLLAASLGAEWGGFGQALFVQPLEQAWQRVLHPTAAGLNRHWQRAIVDPWDSAFVGRYPFAATGSDASLPMLGQMIRADSGRIDQFLAQQLGGVLRKEGNRWVADPGHSQGLRFNPEFLRAVNRLGELADVLFTDGGLGLEFELQAKPVRDVVQTTLILDGARLEYFNQRERWQRFGWPGVHAHPGASLTWTSVRTGERLFGDYPGTWGLIRLLEQAQATPLDDNGSRYRLVLAAPDGLGLTWYLRTELGAGPLALLQLRGFKLPAQIFLDERTAPLALTRTGALP